MPDILTIGYEGLVSSQLVDLVVAARVQTVFDVRAIAASRKAGFSKTILAATLSAHGVDYVHDRRLGTPKAGRQAVRRGHVSEMAAIFEEHMSTEPAREALEAAAELAGENTICLLCFERSPHDCHRSIVAQMIRARTGQAIRHL
jgi:uncharacterized protein (DUF488 family)